MKSSWIMSVCIAGSIAAAGRDATAGTNPSVNWSISGAGCALETGSTPRALVNAATGDVSFNAGQTGTIRLICPVQGLFANDRGDAPNSLDVEFYDTDGTTNNCSVKAFLNRTNRGGTEGGGTIAGYDSTINDSNGPRNSSPFRNLRFSDFTHAWNFNANFYWVEVILFRNTTTCNAAVEGVTLSAQTIIL